MAQPGLFESSQQIDTTTVLLYALGEFQSRGHELADRELALDRLHGAFVRAFEKFGTGQLSDETIVRALRGLGAVVNDIPDFVAKRPYRVIVPEQLCQQALDLFANSVRKNQV